MITIKEAIDKSADFLLKKGVSSPKRQAEEIVSFSLLKSRLDLYMHFEKPLTESELALIRENLKRRANREPIQYIEGRLSFYNCQLNVNRNALIPRQETELLVEKIVECLKIEHLEKKTLWDIGTGSGAIAIAIKKMFPNLKVIASDLSREAIELAKENAKQNQVEIEFLQGDLLKPFENQKADFIVSNPPYIPEKEYESLEAEVKLFEPKMSLISGKTGLEFYERYARDIKEYLREKGRAFFEIGYNQGEKVKQIFNDKGFDKTWFEKDFSSNDRFFFLELE